MVWVKGAAAVGVLLVGGGAWWVTNELMPPIHQTQTDIHSHSTKLLKLEGAINVLTNQQSDQTQRLIHDLLAAAKGAKPEIAAKATQAAASLMETLKADKRPAAPQFFEDATQGIGTLLKSGKAEVRTVAFGTQRQLAEYRSALQPPVQGGFDCKGANIRSFLGAGGDKSKANRLVRGLV